jgi:hypothetical protein
MSKSSWLVGSICSFDDQTVDFDKGAGAVPVAMTFAYEGTYLTHATAALGMMDTLEADLTSGGLTNAAVFLGEDGLVHITSDDTFTLDWTSAGTALRNALGFSGNLTPTATSHTADNPSPLLWIPRRNESPQKAGLGIDGELQEDVVRVVSRDGTQVTRTYGDGVTSNRFLWQYINRDQFRTTTASQAGELHHFYGECLSPGANVMLYRQVDADYASTTAVTLGTPLGPYQTTGKERGLPFVPSPGFANSDCRMDFTWSALKVPEYTT